MGHTRLGPVPKSLPWRKVVAAVTEGIGGGGTGVVATDDVEAIAHRTLNAAEGGLGVAVRDEGLRYTFYLLTQVVLAAKAPDWHTRLGTAGVQVPAGGGIIDFAAAFQNAVDDYVYVHGGATDISEIAQAAAGEAILSLAGPRSETLFGSGREELRLALRGLSTPNGFSELGQRFFGGFMARFLNFYLSRITAGAVGTDRLTQVGDLSSFNNALRLHCHQSARIVRSFCGQWYSKTEFEEGIDPKNTARFMAVALKKLRAELAQQGAES